MPATRRILILAGEASGDLLAAEMMQALQKREPDVDFTFVGVGGRAMQAAGLQLLFPMDDVAVMGLWEVLPKLFILRNRLKLIEKTLQEQTFDAVVTVDAQDFSKRVGLLAKQIVPQVPRIHYVCPKVWAWRPKRAAVYAATFTQILAVLPFEPEFFQKYGGKCTYVGHSVLQRLGAYTPQTLDPQPNAQLALMVGSRQQEILRHWPLMRAVYLTLKQDIPDLTAMVPLVKETDKVLIKDIPAGIALVAGEGRYAALAQCRAAVSKSGTGNLELAVLGLPMVVGYKMSGLTYRVLRWLVKIPYISLVNWVAGKKVVPELIQDDFDVPHVVAAVKPLLTSNTAWLAQAEHLLHVRQKLAQVDGHPAELAAAEVLDCLNKNIS